MSNKKFFIIIFAIVVLIVLGFIITSNPEVIVPSEFEKNSDGTYENSEHLKLLIIPYANAELTMDDAPGYDASPSKEKNIFTFMDNNTNQYGVFEDIVLDGDNPTYNTTNTKYQILIYSDNPNNINKCLDALIELNKLNEINP